MEMVNLTVGWAGILAGLIAGAVIGMFFEKENWAGGYDSWRRRMIRLTHISLVGTGLLNLAYALTVRNMSPGHSQLLQSSLFLAGAVTMPLVCGLSAWRRVFRHMFFVPVLSLIAATVSIIYGVIRK